MATLSVNGAKVNSLSMPGQSSQGPDKLSSVPPTLFQDVEPVPTADDLWDSGINYYDNLLALKEQHKRTLDMCEQLYSQKIALQDMRSSRVPTRVSLCDDFALTPDHYVKDEPHEVTDGILNTSFEELRKSYGKTKGGDYTTARPKSVSEIGPYFPPTYVSRLTGKHKPDPVSIENLVHDMVHDSSEETKEMAMKKINNMWRDFAVPHKTKMTGKRIRPKSATTTKKSKPNVPVAVPETKEWKPRITIPEPFQMSLREDKKVIHKSKVTEELEKMRIEREAQELAECKKQFRANPVPAHVFMPLYYDIIETQEARRRYNHEHCKTMLKSTERPFQFSLRDEEMKKSNQKKNTKSLSKLDDENRTEFRAQPFPEHLFHGNAMEKIEQDDEYRKVRVKIRAEKLLKQAKLPPSMQEKGLHYSKAKFHDYDERSQSAGANKENLFRPKINDYVPDFEELHRQLSKEMRQRKFEKEGTVCRPFHFESNKLIQKKKHKIYEDITKDSAVQDLNKNNNQNQNNHSEKRRNSAKSTLDRHLSTSMDALPTKMTIAAELRNGATKQRMQQKAEEERATLEAERRKRMKDDRLHKEIKEKALAKDNTYQIKQQQSQKLYDFKESDRARQIEYQKQLNEMKDRIEKRPFLFELSAQENAKKAATKKYQEALRKAGLSEELL